MQSEENCKNCKYSTGTWHNKVYCRRYPPYISIKTKEYLEPVTGRDSTALSNSVDEDWWCGEWKGRGLG